jgi:hypothetical protein
MIIKIRRLRAPNCFELFARTQVLTAGFLRKRLIGLLSQRDSKFVSKICERIRHALIDLSLDHLRRTRPGRLRTGQVSPEHTVRVNELADSHDEGASRRELSGFDAVDEGPDCRR